MATLNGNNVYLELDGVDVSAYFTGEISRTTTNNTQETTAGSGRTGVQRAAGLNDYSLELSLAYDVADLGTYKGKLVKGAAYTMIYGPEGNGSGKPKDEVPVIIASVSGPNITIDKQMVMFEVSFQQADEPITLIESGGTFT